MDESSSPKLAFDEARIAAVAPHAAQSREPSAVISPDDWGTDAATLSISTL